MTRVRLRDLPDLGQIYDHQYDHTRWSDHIDRVAETIRFAQQYTLRPEVLSIADLSCGDAAIANGARQVHHTLYLGDFTPGYEYTGRIEDTIDQIPDVDLFICSETIEHIDDPDALLLKIRAKAKHLVLTTPDGEFTNENPEHVWGWDSESMREMLEAAGFAPDAHATFTFPPGYYTFQFWACS